MRLLAVIPDCSERRWVWQPTTLQKALTICPARCWMSPIFICPKPLSSLVWALYQWTSHIPVHTITNSYVKCISEGAMCIRNAEWQKAYKRHHQNVAHFHPSHSSLHEWAVCQVVPLSLREDNALLFFHKVVEMVPVNSSAIYYTQCKTADSYICLLLKSFFLISRIFNYWVFFYCSKCFKVSLWIGYVFE